ncbi:MAG TPA: FkbM family methyltransferase, partial [Micromonosporaceae bacterium]
HVCEATRQHVRTGDTVVDIGANVGCIGLLAAHLVGPSGTVVAVEPNPDNLQLLYAGIVANGVANLRVLPYAASDRRQVFSLAGGTSNTHLVAARPAADQAAYAQSVVLDEELADLARIDFVKIDVEGHEPLALRGFAGLLRKHRPTLLTEFNPYFLRRNQGIEPVEYARQLLVEYPRLEVLSAFGDAASFDDPDGLMDYWTRRSREIAEAGILPAGMLHFDLLATPR